MYGEHVLADWIAVRLEPFEQARWIAAHAMASVIAVGFLTYLHIVIGEMVPKALALQRAARTVLYVTPLIIGDPDRAAAGDRRAECDRQRLAASGWRATRGGRSRSGTTRRKSCSTSSKRARKAAC